MAAWQRRQKRGRGGGGERERKREREGRGGGWLARTWMLCQAAQLEMLVVMFLAMVSVMLVSPLSSSMSHVPGIGASGAAASGGIGMGMEVDGGLPGGCGPWKGVSVPASLGGVALSWAADFRLGLGGGTSISAEGHGHVVRSWERTNGNVSDNILIRCSIGFVGQENT